MSAREAVIEEIKDAPEPIVQEVYDFVRFLKSKAAAPISTIPSPGAARVLPDFEARKREIFGDRVLPDSQAILDEMRADRI